VEGGKPNSGVLRSQQGEGIGRTLQLLGRLAPFQKTSQVGCWSCSTSINKVLRMSDTLLSFFSVSFVGLKDGMES